MKDLFTDLHRYRTRDDGNSNLEDWLTECLAAVLRSLSKDQLHEFLVGLLRAEPEDAAQLWAGGTPRIETQVDAGQFGRPDLAIFFGSQLVAVFENKVAHSIGGAGDLHEHAEHQLHRYAQWMREQCDGSGSPQTLVFLTHITQPPADFLSVPTSQDHYAGITRVVESWGGAARAIGLITRSEGPRSLASALASAFLGMLQEQDMENEFPDTTDIAATQLFLAHGLAVHNLVEQMWNRVAKVANSNKMSARAVGPQLNVGRYSAYRYVNRIAAVKTPNIFLETGLWFPEVGEGWESHELGSAWITSPQAYLLFAADDDDEFTHIEGSPGEGWMRPASDFLILRPLDQLGAEPDQRASAIFEWLEQEGARLKSFLVDKQLTS